MASISQTSKDSQDDIYEFTREMQISSVSQNIPDTIRRLIACIVTILAVIIVLILVILCISESQTSQIEVRFELIKEYELRYKMMMQVTEVDRTCKASTTSLKRVTNTIGQQTQLVAGLSHTTRNLMFQQGLDYESESVVVSPFAAEGNGMLTTFSHALLMVRPRNHSVVHKQKRGARITDRS